MLTSARETAKEQAKPYETAPQATARCAVCARYVGLVRGQAEVRAARWRPTRSLENMALGPSGEGRRAAVRARPCGCGDARAA